jgi:hypothetical protein
VKIPGQSSRVIFMNSENKLFLTCTAVHDRRNHAFWGLGTGISKEMVG